MRLIRPMLNEKKLFLVQGTPAFSRPVFTVRMEGEDGDRFKTVMQGLRYVASLETDV
jgi:hypothetical protein